MDRRCLTTVTFSAVTLIPSQTLSNNIVFRYLGAGSSL